MAGESTLVLFHIPQSRSFTALWMLEELGRPYRIRTLDLASNEQRSAAYLRINPSGKVPAIADGDIVVTERGAILTYLADRYAPGRLAPTTDAADRGDFLKWMFYADGVIEPLLALRFLKVDVPARAGALAWGEWETMAAVLDEALQGRDWLLGRNFSAADIMLGSMLYWGAMGGVLPDRKPIAGYLDRLKARPGLQRTIANDGSR
jgi:glutathione S-transferase